MQLAKGPAGLDSELVDELAASGLIRLERLRLSSGAVERQHELAAEMFTEGVLANEHVQLTHEVGVEAGSEVSLDALLQTGQPKLVEPFDLDLREALECELGQRRTPPQCKCISQSSLLLELDEAADVELVRFDA